MPDQPSPVALIHNQNHVMHRSDSTSPEDPERLTRVMQYLSGRTTIFTDGIAKLVTKFQPATDTEVSLVHDANYIEFIKRYSAKGGGFLGDSTYIAPNSYKVALHAVGGAIEAAKCVMSGEFPSSFALVRPPGHHSSTDRFGGFCIFNNAAITARWLQKNSSAGKIMMVDLDAHAGDGTMRIFYDDPTVFTISLHRDPHDFYPHDGFTHQIGTGKGRGYCANIEMPEGSGDDDYMLALDTIVLPLVGEYKPNVLLVPIGYDAHYAEKQTGMQMTQNGYYRMISALRQFKLPTVLVFEGGYSKANPQVTQAVVMALAGLPAPAHKEEMDMLTASVTRKVNTRAILKDNLNELWGFLSEYHKI
jgi:acetoin utilization deacetylase AcuC-like enzyme